VLGMAAAGRSLGSKGSWILAEMIVTVMEGLEMTRSSRSLVFDIFLLVFCISIYHSRRPEDSDARLLRGCAQYRRAVNKY